MEEVKQFILDYLQREYDLPADVDILSFNYVKEGYIDSLGLLHFIALIEDEFGIAFTDEELGSDDVKIVGRMIALIEKKASERR